MTIFPTKKQWKVWKLPSKASYIGVWIGIIAILLALILQFLSKNKTDITQLANGNNNVQQNNSTTNIGDIKDNINTQVNLNSPNSKQIINRSRKIKKKITFQKEISKNGDYVTRIILTQTDGIWDQGEKFIIQVNLSAPFKKYKFIQGFPSAMSSIYETENEDKTFFSFETTTAPLKEPIILRIISDKDVNIKKISVSPIENEP